MPLHRLPLSELNTLTSHALSCLQWMHLHTLRQSFGSVLQRSNEAARIAEAATALAVHHQLRRLRPAPVCLPHLPQLNDLHAAHLMIKFRGTMPENGATLNIDWAR